MLVYLHYFHSVGNSIRLDTDSKTYHSVPDKGEYDGFYDLLPELVALFVEHGRLYLYFNDRVYDFSPGSSLTFKWEKIENSKFHIISVIDGDRIIDSLGYVQEHEPFSTLAYSLDEPDVNIGLRLYQILNSEERKVYMIQSSQ